MRVHDSKIKRSSLESCFSRTPWLAFKSFKGRRPDANQAPPTLFLPVGEWRARSCPDESTAAMKHATCLQFQI